MTILIVLASNIFTGLLGLIIGYVLGRLKKIADLEWQLKEITEDNDYWQKENAGLKKENTILKGRTEGFEEQILGLLYKYESVYKRFPDLKGAMNEGARVLEENKELKEKLNILENCNKLDDVIAEADKDQLTEAKEIIEELLDTQSCLDPYKDIFKDRVLKAEQFLKDLEK